MKKTVLQKILPLSLLCLSLSAQADDVGLLPTETVMSSNSEWSQDHTEMIVVTRTSAGRTLLSMVDLTQTKPVPAETHATTKELAAARDAFFSKSTGLPK